MRCIKMVVGFGLLAFITASQTAMADGKFAAWWKADGNPTDSASINNATMYGITFVPGISGQAFVLTNNCSSAPCNTGFLSVPHNDAWNFGTNDFSILLWANFAQPFFPANPDISLLSHDDNHDTKWIFSLNQGHLSFHIADVSHGLGYTYPIFQSFTPTLGEWYCFALTRNRSTKTLSLYVNGQVVSQNTNFTNKVPDVNAPLEIGRHETFAQFTGKLDEIYIFNRTLSTNEVQYLYAHPGASPIPQVMIGKAVWTSAEPLEIGVKYQLQISSDMSTWSNHGSAFTATNTTWRSPDYWDVDKWNSLFFRLQTVP